MAGVQEENRRRIALLLLSLGVILVLVGTGLGLQSRQATRSVAAREAPQDGSKRPVVHLKRDQQARLIQQVLFMLLVLVGILSVSLYAFHLWSRRYRRMLLRKPSPPTPSEDVWAMHQLPENAVEEAHGPDQDDSDPGQ